MVNLNLHGFGSKYRTGARLSVDSQSQLTFPLDELVKKERIKENYIDYVRSIMVGFDGEIYLFSSKQMDSSKFDIFIFSPLLELKRTIKDVDFSDKKWLIPLLSMNEKISSGERVKNTEEECFYFYRVLSNVTEIIKFTKDFEVIYHVTYDPNSSSNSFRYILDLAQGKDYTFISFVANYNTSSSYFTFVFSNATGDLVHDLIQPYASSSIQHMYLSNNFKWFVDDNIYRSNTQLNVSSYTQMVEIDIEKFEWKVIETYEIRNTPPIGGMRNPVGSRKLANGDWLVWGGVGNQNQRNFVYTYLDEDFRMTLGRSPGGIAIDGNDGGSGSLFNEDKSWTYLQNDYISNRIVFEPLLADVTRMREGNIVGNIIGKTIVSGNTNYIINPVNNTLVIFDVDRTYNFLNGYVIDANLYNIIAN